MQEVGRMRVDLANMARMAATACLEVGTISRTDKILSDNNSHLFVVFRIEDKQTVRSILKNRSLNWVFFQR
jgi:hypothetical protein